ncbi:MAG: hypothetical protein Q8M95_12465, partial [Candidatus Methanoperedens sp.]|nr:hypothetical protein [Candidatus Methanoperedens sp.]
MENIKRLLRGKTVKHYAIAWLAHGIRARHERHQDCDALHAGFEMAEMDRDILRHFAPSAVNKIKHRKVRKERKVDIE